MTASANFAVPSIRSPIFYPRVKRLFESPIFLGGIYHSTVHMRMVQCSISNKQYMWREHPYFVIMRALFLSVVVVISDTFSQNMQRASLQLKVSSLHQMQVSLYRFAIWMSTMRTDIFAYHDHEKPPSKLVLTDHFSFRQICDIFS